MHRKCAELIVWFTIMGSSNSKQNLLLHRRLRGNYGFLCATLSIQRNNQTLLVVCLRQKRVPHKRLTLKGIKRINFLEELDKKLNERLSEIYEQ